MFFESHAHYDSERFDKDREEVLASLPAHNVKYVVNVGADIPSTLASIGLAARFDFIWASAGVHPHEARTLNEENFTLLEDCCGQPRVAALGEIGLDFYYDHSPRDVQRYWFRRQLELASARGMPVIIHSRDAAAETFEILAASNVRRGVIHCYSGSAEMALDYVKMGFYIGIGGVLTFENAKKLKETADAVPLENILLETDCPYLAPVPHRGQRNDSRYLSLVAAALADIKHTDPQKIADVTTKNALELYGIPAC